MSYFPKCSLQRLIMEPQLPAIAQLKCGKHPNEQILFVCTGNQWHFEPLCGECVVVHSHDHPVLPKMQLESIHSVLQKALSSQKDRRLAVEALSARCQTLANANSQHIRQDFDRLKTVIIDTVHRVFDAIFTQMEAQWSTRTQESFKQLNEISKEFSQQLPKLKQEKWEDVSEFRSCVKKTYFKDVSFEEISAEVSSIEENIKGKPYTTPTEEEIEQLVGNIVRAICTLTKQGKKEDISDSIAPAVATKPKAKGPPRCGDCGSQMEYLTDYKKHLICRKCGQKKRNYIKP